MPYENNIETSINKIYKAKTLHILIYQHFETARFLMPSLSNDEVASSFVKLHKIDIDTLDTQSIIVMYYRMAESVRNDVRLKTFDR